MYHTKVEEEEVEVHRLRLGFHPQKVSSDTNDQKAAAAFSPNGTHSSKYEFFLHGVSQGRF